jgi:hypothetical protein
MQKPFLAILGAALLAGSALYPVSAKEQVKEQVKEHHHVGKAQRPVAAGQSFGNSNAAVWSEPSRYAPMIEPGSPNFYRDEAMSPPAGH